MGINNRLWGRVAIMKKRAGILCSVLVAVLCVVIFYSCWNRNADLGSLDLKGNLFVFGHSARIYEWPDTIPTRPAMNNIIQTKFRCVGHNGKIIFSRSRPLFPRVKPDSVPKSIHPLYFYEWGANEYYFIEEMQKYKYNCRGLDYCTETSQYLFSGHLDKKSGLYLMDTLFNVTDNILPKLDFGEHPIGVFFSYYLDSTTIIIKAYRTIFIVDIQDYTLRKITQGTILAVSHDRKQIAIRSREEDYYIYDVTTGGKTFIEHSPHIFESAFSPDGKFLAYQMSDKYVMYGPTRIYLYDIEKEKSYRTEITDRSIFTLMWLPNNEDVKADSAGI